MWSTRPLLWRLFCCCVLNIVTITLSNCTLLDNNFRLDNDLRGWFGVENDGSIENDTKPKQEPKSLGELLIPPVTQKTVTKKKRHNKGHKR